MQTNDNSERARHVPRVHFVNCTAMCLSIWKKLKRPNDELHLGERYVTQFPRALSDKDSDRVEAKFAQRCDSARSNVVIFSSWNFDFHWLVRERVMEIQTIGQLLVMWPSELWINFSAGGSMNILIRCLPSDRPYGFLLAAPRNNWIRVF